MRNPQSQFMMEESVSSVFLMNFAKIPDVLPCYIGKIPEYSLALVGYTVSTYSATSGARKDQVTANLHIHLGVILHEPFMESADELSHDEKKEEAIDS